MFQYLQSRTNLPTCTPILICLKRDGHVQYNRFDAGPFEVMIKLLHVDVLFSMLKKIPAVKVYSQAPFFNEFTIGIKKSPARLKASFDRSRIIGPLHLGRFKKEWAGQYLVAVTEQRSREDIERLVKAIREA